jgi:hypothetical protein
MEPNPNPEPVVPTNGAKAPTRRRRLRDIPPTEKKRSTKAQKPPAEKSVAEVSAALDKAIAGPETEPESATPVGSVLMGFEGNADAPTKMPDLPQDMELREPAYAAIGRAYVWARQLNIPPSKFIDTCCWVADAARAIGLEPEDG